MPFIMKKIRLAYLVSHPIQYQAPLLRRINQEPDIDLTVYFCWDFGIKEKTYDKEFGRRIKWDIPILEGYKYKFLTNFSLNPSSNFLGQINPGIIWELIKHRYDAVLVFSWNSFTNWLAFFTAFVIKTPVFLRGENPFNQELLKSNFKRKIKKIILGWLFKRIDAFLCIGEENKKFYQHYNVPKSKLFFVPYAVDNERFIGEFWRLRNKKNEFKKELGIGPNDAVILFVGKLINKKRPLDLLMAYEKIKKDEKALVFVGEGILRKDIEKYIKEKNLKNIYFAGFKNQTELSKYYALADILVLPSQEGETWGLVVNEAMCFGLPVIISDVVGCGSDLVKEGINGYIFPVGDIDKLSQRLEDLIENPQKRMDFGEKSFEIIQNYSYQKDIEGISAALKR